MKKTTLLIFIILITSIYTLTNFKIKDELLLENFKDQYKIEREMNPEFMKDWSRDTKLKLPQIVKIVNDPFLLDQFVLEFAESDSLEKRNLTDLYMALLDENTEINWNKIVSGNSSKNKMISHEKAEKLYVDYKEFIKDETLQNWTQFFSTQFELIDSKNEIELDDTEILEKMKKLASYKELINYLKRYIELIAYEENRKADSMNIVETEFGKLCVGSSKRDFFPSDCDFYYDFGGDDIYSEIIVSKNNPIKIVIDLSGNDVYGNSEESMFSIRSGLGYFEDKSGSDFYHGGEGSFSSICGFGEFIDKDGDDVYSTGKFSLAGSALGAFRFNDLAGNDTYRSKEYSQAFAGPIGLSLFYDDSGDDLYHCFGDERHAPLAPNDARSLGQGFSYGFRNQLCGGVAILWDSDGNDSYEGAVYAQGVGYWYAIGAVVDLKGNDSYNAIYYPQGSGIHLACGFLYDGDGEDHYYSKHGPGQGAGHDYGSGVFIDVAGDDAYSIEGGNGLGISNGVGIFLDYSGKDRYERANMQNYGFANGARSSGSIGIFKDYSGDDSYPISEVKNDSLWLRGTFAFGEDVNSVSEKSERKDLEQLNYNIDSLAVISQIFTIASEWEVNQNKKRVRRARNVLIDREKESLEYILENKINSKSGLEFRAIKEFFEKTKNNESLRRILSDKDSLKVENAISLLANNKDAKSLAKFKKLLKQNKSKRTILGSLGRYKDNEIVVSILKKYKNDKDEKIRVTIAKSLRSIDTSASRKVLLSMSNDSSYLIQSLIKLEKRRWEKVESEK